MNRVYERSALTVCALALLTIAVRMSVPQASAQSATSTADELTVRRLRIVDASGAVRLLLTGKPIPEGTLGGKNLPARPDGLRESAGLLFYNDRGDEQGGLTYDGSDGTQTAALTFDAWQQDQALEIQHRDWPAGSDSYIAGNDLPKTALIPVAEAFYRDLAAAKTDADRAAVGTRYRREGRFGRERFLVGERVGVSQLRLDDAQGRPRLRLTVTPAGAAAIEFLDESGTVVKTVTPRS
jgi:hypothetical protein